MSVQWKSPAIGLAPYGYPSGLSIARQTYPAGVMILRQGDASSAVYLLDRGIIKKVYGYDNGDEVILNFSGGGCAYGATAAAEIQVEEAVVTVTKCAVYVLSIGVFKELLTTDAEFRQRLYQALSRELYEQNQRLAQLRFGDARARLENLLWRFIGLLGLDAKQANLKLQLPIQQYEIAAYIDTDPTYVSKLMRRLQNDEVIRRDKGWLIIPEPQRLRHLPDALAPVQDWHCTSAISGLQQCNDKSAAVSVR